MASVLPTEARVAGRSCVLLFDDVQVFRINVLSKEAYFVRFVRRLPLYYVSCIRRSDVTLSDDVFRTNLLSKGSISCALGFLVCLYYVSCIGRSDVTVSGDVIKFSH